MSIQNAGGTSPQLQENHYLEKDLLHFQPLSSRLYSGIQHGCANVMQFGQEREWDGRVVRGVTTGIAMTAHVLTIPVAIIETLALGIIGSIGAIIHICQGAESEFLEKYSAKALAYSVNSFITLVLEVASLINPDSEVSFPAYHSIASTIDHAAYVSSAMVTHIYTVAIFDSVRDNETDAIVVRPLQALLEDLPDAARDIVGSFIQDFDLSEAREVTDFYERLTDQERGILRNLNIRTIFDDAFLRELYPIILRFMQLANLSTGEVNLETGNNEVILNQYSHEEKMYQNHLKECVKDAVKGMVEYKDVKYLDPDGDEKRGRELLEIFDASAAQPIAHIAQWIELVKDNSCPSSFQHRELVAYNSRQEKLVNTRNDFNKLSAKDKDLLVERLIKGSDFDLQGRTLENREVFDCVYLNITTLAADIHQGKLMSVTTMSLEADGVPFSSKNLFGEAWGEAVNELDSMA